MTGNDMAGMGDENMEDNGTREEGYENTHTECPAEQGQSRK